MHLTCALPVWWQWTLPQVCYERNLFNLCCNSYKLLASISLLVFTPNSAPLSLANLLWIVTTTDHILKIITVLLKGLLASFPLGFFPISHRVRKLKFILLLMGFRISQFILRLGEIFRFHWKIVSPLPSISCSPTMDSLPSNKSIKWKFGLILLRYPHWSLSVWDLFNMQSLWGYQTCHRMEAFSVKTFSKHSKIMSSKTYPAIFHYCNFVTHPALWKSSFQWTTTRCRPNVPYLSWWLPKTYVPLLQTYILRRLPGDVAG